MYKKILPYIFIALIAIGIFVSGFLTGIKFLESMKTTTMLQDEFLDSTIAMSTLNYLDEGENEKARQYLLLYLDSGIFGINALAEGADKQSYETACNIMIRIAKHRKEHPLKYSNYTYIENDKIGNKTFVIQKEVAQILDKWESCRNPK